MEQIKQALKSRTVKFGVALASAIVVLRFITTQPISEK